MPNLNNLYININYYIRDYFINVITYLKIYNFSKIYYKIII